MRGPRTRRLALLALSLLVSARAKADEGGAAAAAGAVPAPPPSAAIEEGAGTAARPAPRLGGAIESGYWSGSKNLDDNDNIWATRFSGRLDAQLTDSLRFHLEGRIWSQSSASGGSTTRGEFRELWIDEEIGQSAEIRLGRQAVTWGRADGINPTDRINPRDLTRLVPEESEQKLGSWLLRVTGYLGSWSLSGLWMLNFAPSIFPLPPLAPGTTLSQQMPTEAARQGALKLETTGGAVDASLSYFDGYDHLPDLTFSGTAITLFYPRIRVAGADAAKNFGHWGMRAEAAYTFQDEGVGGALPPRQDVLSWVVGIDRSFFEYLNLNVQYLGRFVPRFSDPSAIADPTVRSFATLRALLIQEQTALQNGLAVRASYKWLHETLAAELRAVTWFQGRDYLVSPRVSYAVSDSMKASAGADVYRGPADSVFGFLKQNSLAFAELSYAF